MSRYRPVLRMARRDALRAKGRTALVLGMIGLPVMAIVCLAVFVRTAEWSPREELPYRLGAADALLTATGRGRVTQGADDAAYSTSGGGPRGARPWTTAEVEARVAARYGPQARVLPLGTDMAVGLRTPRGRIRADLTELDVRDPLARGLFRITEGRPPASPDEIALAPSFARRGFPIGAEVEVDGSGVRKRVVGYARAARRPGDPVALALPGALPGARPDRPQWLVGAGRAVTWSDVTAFNATGLAVLSRSVVRHPPAAAAAGGRAVTGGSASARDAPVIALAVAMVALEAVLLAGPSFAVGVRRSRRLLALVAAAGGEPRHLRAIVLAGGLVLGGAAAGGGAVLGITAAAALKAAAEASGDRLLGPFEVPWPVVAATLLLGAGSGVAAAYAPARQAARMDVVAALGGRRDAARARRGWPLAGAAAIAAGVLLSLAGVRFLREFGAALGAAAIIIGCVLAAPWLVTAAGRHAGRLPLPLRLAVRDGARNPGRSAPVVSAIMAAVAAATTLAIGGASDFRQERLEYEPRQPLGTALVRPPEGRADEVGAALRRDLPGLPLVPLRTLPALEGPCGAAEAAACPGVTFATRDATEYRSITLDNVVGGAREARLLLGRDDPEVTAALAQGRIVLFGAQPPPHGTTTATVAVQEGDRRRTLRTVRDLPAAGVAADPHVGALVPPAAAARVGLPVRTAAFGVDRAEHRVTRAEEARVTEVLGGFGPTDGDVYVERGFTESFGPVLLALTGAAAVLALGGALLGTRLASADARPDLATLAAVGARPRTRRALTMGQAGFLASLGCWLGIAAGLVPGIAVARPLTADAGGTGAPHGTIVVIPWEPLLAVGIGVPLIAVAAAGLLTRSRLPLAQRLAS